MSKNYDDLMSISTKRTVIISALLCTIPASRHLKDFYEVPNDLVEQAWLGDCEPVLKWGVNLPTIEDSNKLSYCIVRILDVARGAMQDMEKVLCTN